MKRIILSEEEKDNIKSQHDDIDKKLMNFFLRRYKVEGRKIDGGWEDVKPLIVTEYTFEGMPGYGFNSFASKKDMERKIISMLYENDIVENHPYDLDEQDPIRVKTIKTIRKFLDFILQKNDK
jgi:hypothetical protein